MKRHHRIALALALAVAATPARAHADPAVPQLGAGCSPELADVMTLLPDERTYAVCQEAPGGFVWSAAPTPFEPNDTWLSYGPPITLHGQGMRNPNLTSGSWIATPQDPESACRVQQTTVVEAGVLAPPQVSEGEQGKELSVQMLPRLFYAELSGNCLWVRA